ncbi:MAG: M16 family metallopeptidase [Candidatus Omnitrophota bacterium]
MKKHIYNMVWTKRIAANRLILCALLMLAVLVSAGYGYGAPPEKTGSTFKMPAYEKVVLANGLTVYLMEQHKVPLIYVSAIFPAGAINDRTKNGLASFTAECLPFGTKSYTKQQIEEKLDFLNARLYCTAGPEVARLSLSFLHSDMDSVLPIMREMIVCPVFDRTEVEKEKKRLLLELEQQKERPAQVIQSYFNKFIFGNDAYGNPISGTRSTAASLTCEDLKSFYQTYYKPQGSAIAVVGDFNTAEMKGKIQDLFKDWQVDGAPQPIGERPLPVCTRSRVLLINKEDATETRFMIGSIGVNQGNPDYTGIQLVNTILGGRFTSWLNDELRVKNGLTYGAKSMFNCLKTAGTFVVGSFTRTENTIRALDLTVEVLNRLHQKKLDPELLASAKNYLKGQFPPTVETAGQLAQLLTHMFYYGLTDSYINDFEKNVDSITLEKTNEIIARYFPKDKLQFVLIGKASQIADSVRKYGEVTRKEIKDDSF